MKSLITHSINSMLLVNQNTRDRPIACVDSERTFYIKGRYRVCISICPDSARLIPFEIKRYYNVDFKRDKSGRMRIYNPPQINTLAPPLNALHQRSYIFAQKCRNMYFVFARVVDYFYKKNAYFVKISKQLRRGGGLSRRPHSVER